MIVYQIHIISLKHIISVAIFCIVLLYLQAGLKISDQSESESDQEPRVRARSSVISPTDSKAVAAKVAANKRKSARFSGTPTDR